MEKNGFGPAGLGSVVCGKLRRSMGGSKIGVCGLPMFSFCWVYSHGVGGLTNSRAGDRPVFASRIGSAWSWRHVSEEDGMPWGRERSRNSCIEDLGKEDSPPLRKSNNARNRTRAPVHEVSLAFVVSGGDTCRPV